MKKFDKNCITCGESFSTADKDRNYCSRKICDENAKIEEIEQAIDRLARLVTDHIIFLKKAKQRSKNRYLTVKNLPRERYGITPKFDIETQEIIHLPFKNLLNNR